MLVQDGAMPVGAERKWEVERNDIGCMVGEDGLEKDSRHGPIAGSGGRGLGSSWHGRMGCVAKEGTGTVPHEDRRDPMNCIGTGTGAGKGGSSCGVAMERGTTQ